MVLMLLGGQGEELLHALQGQIPCLLRVLLASHDRSFQRHLIYNLFLLSGLFGLLMSTRPLSITITAEMQEYILSRSTDMRVATTCEGPLIFPVRISPPKSTDLVLAVGGRKVFVSSLQAQFLKVIDESMLPRCALESRGAGPRGCR